MGTTAEERGSGSMKIAIFDPYLDALEGGEKYMLTAASVLAKKHTVSVLWDDTDILTKGSEKYQLDLTSVTREENIFSPNFSSIERLQRTKKYDAIFFLSDGSIPLVSCSLYLHFQFPVEWVKSNLATRVKLAKVKKIICNSQFTKQYIDKTFKKKSIVLYPPAITEDEKTPSLDDKRNVILTVGRYNKLPNGEQFKKHNRMIDAFKKMIDDGLHEWKFILVISYQRRDQDAYDLEDMTKGYPIQIKRNIPRKDLLSLYTKASLYWHASGFGEDIEKRPELTEHFGISTVEAMHFGAVPVVINAGGQKEIVTENKTGMLWQSEAELINKTYGLMRNEKKRKELANAAIVASKQFTVERFSTHLLQLFP